MPPFTLSVKSFIPPELPPQPALPASAFRSSLIPGIPGSATTPLIFTLHLPYARPKNPIFPASHLQVVFTFEGTGTIFLPTTLTAEDFTLVQDAGVPREQRQAAPRDGHDTGAGDDGGEGHLYRAEIPAEIVPRVKVNEGMTPDASVSVYAWKGEKLLGKFELGVIEGLGYVGLKSEEIHKRRVEVWTEARRKGL